jgi:GntR family transcriptional repressor for pyruvate dehydrogenase complex
MTTEKQTSIFIPAQHGRASEDVSLQIEAAIMNGMLKPGDRLPSERELQVYFETGRGVIREALRTLKQKDLIEIKKGAKGGAFVKQVDVVHVSESLSLFLKQQQVSPEAVVEYRKSIDHAVVSLAISRGSVEEKDLLVKSTLELEALSMEEVPQMEKISELDRRLNLILARMTQNAVYEWTMNALQLGFSSYDFALYEDSEYRRKTIANWKKTARLVKQGEILQALSSVSYHYSLLRECIANTADESLQRDVEFLTEEGDSKD